MSKQKPSRDSGEIEPRDLRVYRLKITLRDTDPPIWRRLEVYAGIEMDSLATAIDTKNKAKGSEVTIDVFCKW
jgi:hypothetical protein